MPIGSTLNRREFVATMIASSLVGTRAFAAESALGLSDQAVQVIVAFTPGTTPDLTARLIGPKLSAIGGQPFVVENKAGASGIIGLGQVAKAAPDGHTITFSTNTSLTLPMVYNSVPFDVIDSFTPLAMVGYTNFGLCVHPSLKVKNFAQFVDYVKKNPGTVNYGSPGKGTLHHLLMEMVIAQLGLNMVHVPYKGSAGATTDLLAGHIKAMFQPMHVATPFQQDNRLVILGASRKEPDPVYKTVPPLDTVGLPGFDADGWYAVWGPKGMKADLVSKYNGAINRVLEEADVRSTLVKAGVTPRSMSSAELGTLIKAEFAKWQKVVKAAGITPE